jgi:membrane peptidoglycan carboxypeptidase
VRPSRPSRRPIRRVRGIPLATSGINVRRNRGRPHPALLGLRHTDRGRSPGANLGLALAVAFMALIITGAGSVGLGGLVTGASIAMLSEDLPDPTKLEELQFAQPTIVYDREGRIELGRFQQQARRVVDYPDIPPLVLDATVVAEDRTFWENDGFDAAAILSAAMDTLQGDGRGASTITQQLVRARLLPEEVVGPGSDLYLRKAKEIIQSVRLTEAYPGQTGKEMIITAYLNEIFYGHGAYGIAAAAKTYFGIDDLNDLTIAQAALLAALPQSPSILDPYRYVIEDEDGRLVVDPRSPPMLRRNWILASMDYARWTEMTPAQQRAAQREPAILSGRDPIVFRAPHFTWQVRRQLEAIVGGSAEVETGGYRVITTLDWRAHKLAEKWLELAAIVPNLPKDEGNAILDAYEVPKKERAWITNLRGKDLQNGAIVAIDYRTGDVRAYAGSAGYYRDDLANPKFDPKYDAAGAAARQPGSAFKPIVYATGFEQGVLTPGSLLLDITTRFNPSGSWAPRDADFLDRGPVLAREALQYSLNVPAIRALEKVGVEALADQSASLGIRYNGGRTTLVQAGLSGAIGTVEVRPIDLTAAYGAFGNGGILMPPRMILEVRDSSGNVVWSPPEDPGRDAISPQSAYLVTDILLGNTDGKQNPFWSKVLEVLNGPDKERRPVAAKTGTSNDARDVSTYGYVAAPEDDGPAWAIGAWMGNSDHSKPDAKSPATSLTSVAPMWRAYVRELTNKDPIAKFERPDGISTATIDLWSGGSPGAWTRQTRKELFIAGTEPGAGGAIDEPGLLYSRCGGSWAVNVVKAERGPDHWLEDVRDWAARARRGTGVKGELNSSTAYFWFREGWGGPIASGRCETASGPGASLAWLEDPVVVPLLLPPA